MKKQFVIFFVLLSIIRPTFINGQSNSYSIEKSTTTSITCIQINSTGDVSISWNQAVDPTNSFLKYEVHSVQSGLLATINSITITSFIQAGVSKIENYYLLTHFSSSDTTSSDTLSPIFLTLNNPSNGTAVLQWNNPKINQLPTMDSYYKIYREYPAGTWSIRDSVPYGVTFFKDTIDICKTFLNYQIVLGNQICSFESNIQGDNFVDITTPDIPVINSVSVDTLTGNVIISWNENHQKDTEGYIVYLIDQPGVLSEIATVIGRHSTTFVYSTNATSKNLTFSVAAFDQCFIPNSETTHQTSAKAETHTTIVAKSQLNICNRDIKFTWTPYTGWKSSSRYEIWGHIIGEPWKKFGDTNSLEYHIIGEALQKYCFVVKAVSADGQESFSNKLCLTVNSPSQPSYNYLNLATVNNNTIELHHSVELKTGVKEILFEKYNNTANQFEEIARIPVTQVERVVVDTKVDVSQNSYTYRAIVVDSCDNLGSISNLATTILLSVQNNTNDKINYLTWTPYFQFDGPILSYEIYKGYDGVFDPTPLIIVPNSRLNYEDSITAIDYSGKTCYYITATEGYNTYGKHEISFSNTVCQVIEPLIFIPNSFTPNDDLLNDVFLPQVSLFEQTSYDLSIFDRWEHLIFQSNSLEKGWDGSIRSTGNKAVPGTYVYLLTIKDGNGIEIKKRGHVNVLK